MAMPHSEARKTDAPTVFIIDDEATVREALGRLMAAVEIAHRSYASPIDFLQEYSPEWLGCVLLDERMPGMSGHSLQAELIARLSTLPIIVMTGHAEVPMAVEAMKLGAADFIQKPLSEQEVLDAVYAALAQSQQWTEETAECDSYLARTAQLTSRERQTMDLVVAGKANKVIATELGINERTVEEHRAHMMSKMEVASVAELVRLVTRFTPA
ncbi:MAG: response regulator transcription factor [Candidatus Binatia bacterium]